MVSLQSFVLFRSAVPVGRRQKKPLSSIPQSTRQHSVGQPRKRAGHHYASSPSSPHAHFLRSAGLLHPQYSPAEKAGQYYVCRPYFFRRLLLCTVIYFPSPYKRCSLLNKMHTATKNKKKKVKISSGFKK